MNKNLFFIIALFFLASNFSNAQGNIRSSNYRKSSIVWLDHIAFIINHKTKSVKELYNDVNHSFYITENGEYSLEEVEKMTQENGDLLDWDEQTKYLNQIDNKMLSIVGPYICYQEDYYAEGGAHPSYGTIYHTYNIKTDTSIRMQDLFNEQDILLALQKNEIIQDYLIEKKPVVSLESLFNNLDGECDFYFSIDILENFAFHHLEGNQVEVRIGVSYGCEVMRGNFEQIALYLPIPKSLKKVLKKADKKGTLMCDMN